MTEAEQDWLDWAAIAGGILEVPWSRASDPALLSLISKGYLVPIPAGEGASLRYALAGDYEAPPGVIVRSGPSSDEMND